MESTSVSSTMSSSSSSTSSSINSPVVWVVDSQATGECEYTIHGYSDSEDIARHHMERAAEKSYRAAAKVPEDKAFPHSPLFDTVPLDKIAEGYAVRFSPENTNRDRIKLYEITRAMLWPWGKGPREARVIREFRLRAIRPFAAPVEVKSDV